MPRQQRENTTTPSELRALRARASEAYKLRRKDQGDDPELLLAAVVWPTRPELRTLELRQLAART